MPSIHADYPEPLRTCELTSPDNVCPAWLSPNKKTRGKVFGKAEYPNIVVDDEDEPIDLGGILCRE